MPEALDLMIAAENVTKRFPSGDFYIDVLKGVDLIARKGELLMIVGNSGSGKTTLLCTLTGTLDFDEGEIKLYGHSLKNMSDAQKAELRRTSIGFIFQQYHLIKSINVMQNVSIPLILNRIKRDEAEERAIILLEKVGLKDKALVMPSHLSGGEQQRVAIARALIHEPSLVICDEPTAALDAESGSRVMKVLIEVASSPERCMIIVTHDGRIFKYANRIVRMEDGLIVREETGIEEYE